MCVAVALFTSLPLCQLAGGSKNRFFLFFFGSFFNYLRTITKKVILTLVTLLFAQYSAC